MMAGAAVHDRGEAMLDGHLRRVLRGPLGEPFIEIHPVVLTKLPKNSTTDDADEGARTRQIAQVVADPSVLRRDPDGRSFAAEYWDTCRWCLGRYPTGPRGPQSHYRYAASR